MRSIPQRLSHGHHIIRLLQKRVLPPRQNILRISKSHGIPPCPAIGTDILPVLRRWIDGQATTVRGHGVGPSLSFGFEARAEFEGGVFLVVHFVPFLAVLVVGGEPFFVPVRLLDGGRFVGSDCH